MIEDSATYEGHEENGAKEGNDKSNRESNSVEEGDKTLRSPEAEDLLERLKYHQELVDLERKVGKIAVHFR